MFRLRPVLYRTYLHELLDINSPAFFVESGGGETVSEDDIAAGDHFFGVFVGAAFSRSIRAEKSVVDLAGNVRNHLSFDFENDLIDDLYGTV